MSSRGAFAALSLIALACGPKQLGADTSGDDSTSTSETGEPPTTESSEGTEIIPDPDTPPPPCEPFAQNCPEGEKCVSYSVNGGGWNEFKCVPIMGDQAPGEPCVYGGYEEATDDCDATSACWDVHEIDGELIGSCREFCTEGPDWPECPEDHKCLIGSSGAPALCIPTCDPLTRDCPDGQGCYWAGGDFNCIYTSEKHRRRATVRLHQRLRAGARVLHRRGDPGLRGLVVLLGLL